MLLTATVKIHSLISLTWPLIDWLCTVWPRISPGDFCTITSTWIRLKENFSLMDDGLLGLMASFQSLWEIDWIHWDIERLSFMRWEGENTKKTLLYRNFKVFIYFQYLWIGCLNTRFKKRDFISKRLPWKRFHSEYFVIDRFLILVHFFLFHFQYIGNRGQDSQSAIHGFDHITGNVFFASINKNAVTCWNSRKKLTPENVGIVAQDNETMIYPNDLKVTTSYRNHTFK